MPQFEMPFESSVDLKTFSELDAFTQAYIEAVFWTECNSDNPELADATFADLDAASLGAIVTDCENFQTNNAATLHKAYSVDGYNATRAGHDYWLTRNGHGAGFWDRDLGRVGDTLSDACRHREAYVYRGDDGKVYVQ
jgi:hypothetical protein